MLLTNVTLFGFEIDTREEQELDHKKIAGFLDVCAGAFTLLPLTIAAFAVKQNAVKPRWIWSAICIPVGFLATHFSAKDFEKDETGRRGLLLGLAAILITGTGIGLAPLTTQILSTNLRIGTVGAVGFLSTAGIAALVFSAE